MQCVLLVVVIIADSEENKCFRPWDHVVCVLREVLSGIPLCTHILHFYTYLFEKESQRVDLRENLRSKITSSILRFVLKIRFTGGYRSFSRLTRGTCSYEPHVFVLLWFLKSTLPSQERAFRKGSSCHFWTGKRRKPAPTNLDSQPAMSCTFGSVHMWRCTKRSTWKGAVEQTRAPCERRTRKVQNLISIGNDRYPPTHHSKCITFRKKNGELMRCSLGAIKSNLNISLQNTHSTTCPAI